MILFLLLSFVISFHDCVQHHSVSRAPPNLRDLKPNTACSGGLCLGMHDGPHEGGPASYPVGNAKDGFTSVRSTMTVPELPHAQDGICYYIWTDIFFGDMGLGRMNQFVPQLILGNALDGSSGPPLFTPKFGTHKTWMFGAHYFFEIANLTTGKLEAKAAYGDLYPTTAGEMLFTSFEATPNAVGDFIWTLKMGVVDDATRTSVVEVPAPYMGLGKLWPGDLKVDSWSGKNFTNMCVNACWELYGAKDAAHLPSNGSHYDVMITRPASDAFPWVQKWDEDEGKGKTCAKSNIREFHNDTVQHVLWDITI